MLSGNEQPTAATKAMLASRSLVFVDLQTTGPDPSRHEIIEIAAVRAHPTLLFVERELATRARPQFPERCSIETAARTGFDPARWDDAPDLYDVLERYAPIAEGCILVAHSAQRIRAFLASGFRRAGLEDRAVDGPVVDTASLAWPFVAIGAIQSLSLSAVCDALGIHDDGIQYPRRDVARTMEVYRRLMALRIAMPAGASPPAEGDEDAILATQATRLAEGRHAYGNWRVGDGRNNPGEALLEVMDALNYCAAELLRLAREKGEG